ncbi:MAG: aldehyde dehydrogenase family protein [Rhizobiaceae bacterium]|nr:aldehyde dehydrogenase family protein [Rhizobiaceae bacterium]MCV0407416.1 aldehyde dehydrogenase family protein [Rhizobiaceae bacterium]
MSEYSFGPLLDGKWVDGEGPAFSTFNPARPGEVVGNYRSAGSGQIAQAGRAARAAQAKWRSLPAAERVKVVGRFLAEVERRSEPIARSITLEQGKPLAESRNETAKALGEAAAMAGHVLSGGTERMADARPGFRNMVTRRPRGVIAAITPWNFPILTPMRKIAPALMHGNAILLKPSEFTPATVCLIAEASEGILPPGLLQVLPGDGRVGAEMVALPEVSGVTFTGSVATGKRIYALGAQTLAELSLELGGKNAAVVNDTDDLDACLDQIAGAAFMCAGQRCTAISRVIVAEPLRQGVEEGLAARARAQRQGDGLDEGVTLGPLTSAAQYARVRDLVEAGRAQGARVVTGGEAGDDPERNGYFYPATILADVTPDMGVAREEIFGPVISVLSYRTLDEAFATLNAVDYGLTSALFSNDYRVIQRFVAESESGMLHVNHGTIPDNHMPFGGIKDSGVGAYSVGASAANFYTTEHSVYLKAG